MRIVITDTSFLWKNQEPILEKFKDELLIVCLEGKTVTDKYECLVSTPKSEVIEKFILSNTEMMLDGLKHDAYCLFELIRQYNDVLFLTDDEPTSLYPYYAFSRHCRFYKRKHLCAISPLLFERFGIINEYRKKLSCLSDLTSILIIDSYEYFNDFGERPIPESVHQKIRADYLAALPYVVDAIENLSGRYYFDFSTNTYADINNSISELEPSMRWLLGLERLDKKKELTHTMGVIPVIHYPVDSTDIKESVEKLETRRDGVLICKYLRELRIKLAALNAIDYEPEVCRHYGACSGTCPVCDQEAAYLREKLNEISPENRIIPNLTLNEWKIK